MVPEIGPSHRFRGKYGLHNPKDIVFQQSKPPNSILYVIFVNKKLLVHETSRRKSHYLFNNVHVQIVPLFFFCLA